MNELPSSRARLFHALTGAWPWELFGWAPRMTQKQRILLFGLVGGGICLLMGFALWQLVGFYQNLTPGVAVYTGQGFPKWWVMSLLIGNLISAAALSTTGILLYGLGHHTAWRRRFGLGAMILGVTILFVLVILAYAFSPEFVQSERVTH